jgi:hypothetical protein
MRVLYALRVLSTLCTLLVGAPVVLGQVTADAIPLIDMGPGVTYYGFEGGLYPGSSNTAPASHLNVGVAEGLAVQPLNTAGQPDPNGAIVLMSVGMSNASQEWCQAIPDPALGCWAWSFTGQALADTTVNHDQLVIVNGAKGGGATADGWDSPDDELYDRIEEDVLPYFGLTEAQVQIVWVKGAYKKSWQYPSMPDPHSNADSLFLGLADVARALRVRYPNLRQVFFTSRIYGGYNLQANAPEPYAYEGGFSVKWLVEAQITQRETGVPHPRAGDLGDTAAPWIGWGPYIWARGDEPRSDGLQWTLDLYQGDQSHPNMQGEELVGGMLLDFFKTSPYTQSWFLANPGEPPAPPDLLARDSLALASLYTALDGPNWADHTGWLVGPVASWYGVTVADGRVTGLALPANALAGALPDLTAAVADSALFALTTLDLSQNALAGEVRAWLGTLPALATLSLQGNGLDAWSGAAGSYAALTSADLGSNALATLPDLTTPGGASGALDTLTVSSNALSRWAWRQAARPTRTRWLMRR